MKSASRSRFRLTNPPLGHQRMVRTMRLCPSGGLVGVPEGWWASRKGGGRFGGGTDGPVTGSRQLPVGELQAVIVG